MKYMALFAPVMLAFGIAAAQIPHTISYQGYYTSNGQPVTGTYPMIFRLDTLQTGGGPIWSQGPQSVPITKGVYSVVLDVSTVAFDRQYWLETVINNVTSANRTQLTGVPYSLAPWVPSGSNVYFNGGNVGIGTSSPTAKLDVGGTLLVNPTNNFVGVNRSTRVSGTEYFGVHAPVGSGQYGGIYVGTQLGGKPYYGYISPTGTELDWTGWTYLDGGDWKLNLVGSDVLTVQYNGKVGIGTANPTAKLDVRGHLTLDAGESPVLYTGTASNELSRYLQLINSPSFPSASGLKAGGILVADDYSYANPGKNDLIVKGRTTTQVLQITGGSDLAELFETEEGEPLEPGTIMAIDPNHPGKLAVSTREYDSKVAGVISGAGGIKPGLTLKQEGMADGNNLVAIAGRVYCKAEALSASIEPGDLLTTSSIPGRAMKAADVVRSHGTVIGKAMTGLKHGKGLILVLVNLQ